MDEFTESCQAKAGGSLTAGISSALYRTEVLLRFVGSRRVWTVLYALAVLGIPSSFCRGGFDTVINVPPDLNTFSTIHSNTQVNVFDGGNVGDSVQLGSQNYAASPLYPNSPSSHIEFNVYGGTVGYNLTAGSWAGTDSDIVVNLFGGSINSNFHADGGTTVNIFGGSIGGNFSATRWQRLGSPPIVGNPIVVNMSGGSLGIFAGVGGTLNLSGGYVAGGFEGAQTLNMSGGVIDSTLDVHQGSVANISGGQINYEVWVDGAVNMSGGTVQSGFLIDNGGIVDMTGGTAESFYTFSGSRLNISGGDYRLDGVSIAGLGNVGNSLGFNIPVGSVLTGTLTDGTPFAIPGADVSQSGDTIADNTLTLHTTAIPAAAPKVFHAPGDVVPRGVHAGQSLIVANGGTIGSGFNASWGSAVTITGGQVGDSFEAVGAVVNISGGIVGDVAKAFMGTLANISGGSVGRDFSATRGSVVSITGGAIGDGFEMRSGAVANISGGSFGDSFLTYGGSQLKISGGEFRLNGVPIGGLQNEGSSRAIDIPSGAMLSGTLSDGTPFAFTEQAGDYISAGTLTLNATSLPAATPAVIQVPHDSAPKGLRTGQTMIVSDGGVVGEKFTADWGSSVTISGGQIGDGFKAFGAFVNISGGTFSGSFRASYGSLTNISGGTFNGRFIAEKGSVVNIYGGALNSDFVTNSGSVVNIAGGTIGDFGYVYDGSTVNLSGGSIGQYSQIMGGTVNMTGGAIGQGTISGQGIVINFSGGTIGHSFGSGGRLIVTGTDLRFNGTPVSFDYDGQQKSINLSSGVLSGTLEDGTPFTFSGQLEDSFASGALNVQLSYVPLPPVPAVIQVPAQPAPVGIRAGQALLLTDGGTIGDGFRMGWGSALTMTGGTIGDNMEAVGAQVTITGGSIGGSLNALYGSTLNIRGGTIYSVNADDGSTVNMTGGMVNNINAKSGSVINISGGSADPGPDGSGYVSFHGSAEGGSEINFFGTGFELNSTPIANLVAGQRVAITDRSAFLSGFLPDGNPFIYYPQFFAANALLTVTSVLYGDFNGDGIVDMSDYVVWRNGLGTIYTQSDYNDWRAHFGQTASGGGSVGANASVPEPATLLPMMLAATAGWCVRRRRAAKRPEQLAENWHRRYMAFGNHASNS